MAWPEQGRQRCRPWSAMRPRARATRSTDSRRPPRARGARNWPTSDTEGGRGDPISTERRHRNADVATRDNQCADPVTSFGMSATSPVVQLPAANGAAGSSQISRKGFSRKGSASPMTSGHPGPALSCPAASARRCVRASTSRRARVKSASAIAARPSCVANKAARRPTCARSGSRYAPVASQFSAHALTGPPYLARSAWMARRDTRIVPAP